MNLEKLVSQKRDYYREKFPDKPFWILKREFWEISTELPEIEYAQERRWHRIFHIP